VRSAAAAKSYAKALFELARERQRVEAIGDELAQAVQAVRDDDELRRFFGRPGVAGAAKRKVAEEIATRLGLAKLVRDFVGLVAEHGRGDQLEAIGVAYRDLADAAIGRVRARVRTAVGLTDDGRRMLASRLSAALGGKQPLIEDVVDKGLLGGFVAEIDSLVVDGSLDGQLARLRDRLAKG